MSVAECNTSCTEVYLACILIENESVKAYLCFHTHEQRERDVSHHVWPHKADLVVGRYQVLACPESTFN